MCIVADGLDPFGTQLDRMTSVVYGDPALTLPARGGPGPRLSSLVSVRGTIMPC